MQINNISFGTYNPGTIVNNPPYITNHPFYEYMKENEYHYDIAEFNASKVLCDEERQHSNHMTKLLVGSLFAVGVTLIIARNKLKSGFYIVKEKCQSFFNKLK